MVHSLAAKLDIPQEKICDLTLIKIAKTYLGAAAHFRDCRNSIYLKVRVNFFNSFFGFGIGAASGCFCRRWQLCARSDSWLLWVTALQTGCHGWRVITCSFHKPSHTHTHTHTHTQIAIRNVRNNSCLLRCSCPLGQPQLWGDADSNILQSRFDLPSKLMLFMSAPWTVNRFS